MKVYFNSIENNKPEFYNVLTDYLENNLTAKFDINDVQKYLNKYYFNNMLSELLKFLPIISTTDILDNEYISNSDENINIVLNQFISENKVLFYNIYDFEYNQNIQPLTNSKILKQITARV